MQSIERETVPERIRHMTPVTARPEEADDVRDLATQINQYRVELRTTVVQRRAPAREQQTGFALRGPNGKELEIPESVFHLLARIVEVLAKGDGVSVVPFSKNLTTQEAANLLNVSRQYFVRLLDDGQIPFTKVGTHRRVKIEDVLSFREKRDRARKKGLEELMEMTEEYGGYPESDP